MCMGFHTRRVLIWMSGEQPRFGFVFGQGHMLYVYPTVKKHARKSLPTGPITMHRDTSFQLTFAVRTRPEGSLPGRHRCCCVIVVNVVATWTSPFATWGFIRLHVTGSRPTCIHSSLLVCPLYYLFHSVSPLECLSFS